MIKHTEQQRMNALDFEQNGYGDFVYQRRDLAFKITPHRFWGWSLAIWQRRWKGDIYRVRFIFTSPIAAAYYGLDFIQRQWLTWVHVRSEVLR